MATKKQKRERGLIKHQEFMADVRRSGLEAQRKDREHRQKKAKQDWQKTHDESHSWRNLVKDCPHCQEKLVNSNKKKSHK